MILDRLDQADRYARLHPGFGQAFGFLRDTELTDWSLGKHAIDGERLFVILGRDQGRGQHGARLEAHRRYIDIQLVLSGQEQFGWRTLSECRQPVEPFDQERDIVFFTDAPTTWLTAGPGEFALFFPGDAHAPLAGQGEILKAVVKVAVDW